MLKTTELHTLKGEFFYVNYSKKRQKAKKDENINKCTHMYKRMPLFSKPKM